MKSYCRPLDDAILVEHFVVNVLEITNNRQCNKAIDLIVRAELQHKGVENKSTLFHDSFRHKDYSSDKKRKELRNKIFEELIIYERLENDDNIKLGRGGALPVGKKVAQSKQAFIIIGLPASGKSSIASKIADEYGCIILDSDYAKRKFPEYKFEVGASLVHEESDEIIFGEQNSVEYNLLEYCCVLGNNIIIPKIGHNERKILDLAEILVDCGYTVHITLVSLDRQKATKRAYNRFKTSKRYVPLSLIFDGYSNDPILAYYRIRENKIFSSHGAISTVGTARCIDYSDGNPAILFEN